MLTATLRHVSPALFLGCLVLAVTPAAFAQNPNLAHQKAALEKACASGAMSRQECQERMAALNGGRTVQASQNGQLQSDGGQVWHDPRGRFSVTIPAGWQLDTSQGNLKIAQGHNWATFDALSNTGQPLDVAQQAASQMQPMVSNWRVANQGPFAGPNGHPAAGMTAVASVATRSGSQQQTFLFVSLSAGSNHYLLMTASADPAQGRAPIEAIMKTFSSIRFAGE